MTGDLPPEAWEENPPSRQASGPATPRGMPTVSLDLARSILGAARTPALLCAARIMGSRVFRTVSRYTFSSTAVSEATGTTTCGHRRGHWPRRFRARRGRRGKGRKGAESGGGYHSSYPRLKVEEHSCICSWWSVRGTHARAQLQRQPRLRMTGTTLHRTAVVSKP
jgi:hypothetical protein